MASAQWEMAIAASAASWIIHLHLPPEFASQPSPTPRARSAPIVCTTATTFEVARLHKRGRRQAAEPLGNAADAEGALV